MKRNTLEWMRSDEGMNAGSVLHGLLENICLNAPKSGCSTVRMIEDAESDQTLIQELINGSFQPAGELPSSITILRRTRMVTNSKGIADNRLPVGELTIPLPNQTLHIKVTKDESMPQNLLEFTVSEVQT
jgi:hypothetical protein